jgi:hypothetical protein
MAPPPQQFRLANVLYTVPILTAPMDAINLEIISIKDEISFLQTQLARKIGDLAFQQKQLLTLYVIETGAFPE